MCEGDSTFALDPKVLKSYLTSLPWDDLFELAERGAVALLASGDGAGEAKVARVRALVESLRRSVHRE